MQDLSPVQQFFLSFVAVKRQQLETLKTIALCRSSMASAAQGEGASELLNLATEALIDYVRSAEHILDKEKATEERLREVLEKETKLLHIIQPV